MNDFQSLALLAHDPRSPDEQTRQVCDMARQVSECDFQCCGVCRGVVANSRQSLHARQQGSISVMHGYGYAYTVSAYPTRVSDGQPDSNTPYPSANGNRLSQSTPETRPPCSCRHDCSASERRPRWARQRVLAQHAVLIHITSKCI